jgi:subtilisin-like proprotein convertase family protein
MDRAVRLTTVMPMTNSMRFRHLTTRAAAMLAGLCVASSGLVLAAAEPAGAAVVDAGNSTPVTSAQTLLDKWNDADMTLPDSGPASTYPSPIDFSGVTGTVSDVSVRLYGVTHQHLDDLDVMLVSPDGHRMMVLSDAGSIGVSGVHLFFNDGAPASVEDSSPPASGAYRPTNFGSVDAFPAPAPDTTGMGSSFSVFDGVDPNGQWKLFVNDDFAGDTGVISGWDLYLHIEAPVAATSVTVAGTTGPITDVDLQLHGVDAVCGNDFDMMLVGPQGQKAMVWSDAADCDTLTGLEITLDDEAAQPLPISTMPTSGTYRPADDDSYSFDYDNIPGVSSGDGVGSALSAFDGTSANGTWTLYVVQDAPNTMGHLAGGWGLHVTTADGTATGTPAPSPTPTTASSADSTAPRVTTSTPKKSATGVKRGANVKATFTEKMRGASVTTKTVRLVEKGSTRAVTAKVTYVAASRTVVLDPASKLAAHTTYRFVVTTGAKDLAGNALDQSPTKSGAQKFTASFRTR